MSIAMDNDQVEIVQQLEQLREKITQNARNEQIYQTHLEQYWLKYSELSQKVQESNSKPRSPENAAVLLHFKRDVDGWYKRVNKQQNELFTNISGVIEMLGKVQTMIIQTRLAKWKREQTLAANGAPMLNANALEEIQTWFQQLAELIVHTKSMIDRMRQTVIMNNVNESTELFDMAYREITSIFQNLIASSFVVEKQPPQVIKTKTQRFGATVRLLLTNIGFHLSNPSVSVFIVSEEQARAIQQNQPFKPNALREILNNRAYLETSGGQLRFDLQNMQLKKFSRDEKKSAESVTDEKFALFFQTALHAGDIQLNVSAISLPLTVIVNNIQKPQAWATILWDNAFADINRPSFTVVDQVPWQQLVSALDLKFHSRTGRCLTGDNIHYLFEKIFSEQMYSDEIDFDRTVTWSQFTKEALPKCQFTFWEWFYAGTELIRDQLIEPWREGLIIGFINGQQAKQMLLNSTPGTFLLRFSDSSLGAITIFWVGISEETDRPEVIKLQPFAQKDLAIRGLGDCIKDLDQCITLYPNIPKDTAFGKYYTPEDGPTTSNGYMKTMLKLVTKESADSHASPRSARSFSTDLSVVSPQPSLSHSDGSESIDENIDLGDISDEVIASVLADLERKQPEQIIDDSFLYEFEDNMNFED